MTDCGCFHPLYLDIDTNREDREPCDLNNETVNTCIAHIMTQINRADRQQQNISNITQSQTIRISYIIRLCNCNASCTEETYEVLLSASKWPSNQFEVGNC